MLVLTFRVAGSPYAVAVARVVEVVPRVALRPVPQAPAYLAGLLLYRGRAVPVVDLAVRVGAAPAADRLNTRIILASAAEGGDLIGLVAERVDEIREVEDASAAPSPSVAGYLGPAYPIDGALVQEIEPGRLLDAAASGAAS
jgi:chemotaxis-related protein WspB